MRTKALILSLALKDRPAAFRRAILLAAQPSVSLRPFVSQQEKQNRARQQADAEARKQELHKWKVLYAQAEVDHQIHLQTPEHCITIGPQHIIAAEKPHNSY